MQFFKDLNLAAFTAGFVAVLVGFTSSVAIVFQAALGSAFRGVVAGAMALFVQQYGQARRPPLPRPAADSPTTSTP
jgi:predicted benzoate:H+ symporter BenE